ncbi:MAG: PAS domain-containing sensor histidine kinase [Actinomycetota bacterium]|nr:PAS domain-containing sensor histidine kinase [Actinomycetota bacterium]
MDAGAAIDSEQLGDASRDVLWQVLQAAPDALMVVDADGIIRLATSRAADMFGQPIEELVGQPIEELVPPNVRKAHRSHREDYVNQPNVRPMGVGLDLQAVAGDGSVFPVEVSLSPLVANGRKLTIAAVRDVTERRANEQQLRLAHEELRLLDERERIARDLHDTVIQRLFAAGMSLQATAVKVDDDPEVRDRLQRAVDDLDETIREIRTAIFGLQAPVQSDSGVRRRLMAILDDIGQTFADPVRLTIDGPVDNLVDERVAEQLLPTVREAVTNAARHAAAATVSVEVRVGDELVLRVRDDGTGFTRTPTRGNGLTNMRARAHRLGGNMDVTSSPEDGTTITWQVPITAAPAAGSPSVEEHDR